jgi:hypothetical protein
LRERSRSRQKECWKNSFQEHHWPQRWISGTDECMPIYFVCKPRCITRQAITVLDNDSKMSFVKKC